MTEPAIRAIGPRPLPDPPRRRRPLRIVSSVFTNGFNAVSGAATRLSRMVFRSYPSRLWNLVGTRVDYLREVGDGTSSSTVAAVLNWIARTFPEAPPTLWRELDNGQEEQVRQHPMLQLLRKPNDFYNGVILWMATVVDYVADGNAYWIKIRDAGGQVVELWWVPSWMIYPRGDAQNFITDYCYTIDGDEKFLPVDDVVHFRFGLDANDPKKGSSQLKSVLREVFTDDEAANFTATLLRNMGVPGLVISPEKGTTLQEGDAEDMKQYVKDKFGGDKRGEAMVMTGATQIAQFGFSPEQLLLRELRRIPEERVSAVTGIPAIVVGFGAGLERSTFTNMGEARAAAYEAGLIPMQRIMAEDVLFQLMTDFVSEDELYTWRFGFDLTKVRVLQEDLYRLVQRHDLSIRGGWEKVSEGRRATGLSVEPEHEIFLRPANYVEVPDDGSPPRPLAPKAQPQTLSQPLAVRLNEISAAIAASDDRQDDLRAIVRELQPAQPPQVHFHEGAIKSEVHPAQVTVESPPAAEITVQPAPPPNVDLHADIHMPDQRPRQAVARKNGDGSIVVTYENDQEAVDAEVR